MRQGDCFQLLSKMKINLMYSADIIWNNNIGYIWGGKYFSINHCLHTRVHLWYGCNNIQNRTSTLNFLFLPKALNPSILSLYWLKKWCFFQWSLKCSSICAWCKEFLLFFKVLIFLCKFGPLCYPLVPQSAWSDGALAVWRIETLPTSAKQGISFG